MPEKVHSLDETGLILAGKQKAVGGGFGESVVMMCLRPPMKSRIWKLLIPGNQFRIRNQAAERVAVP